MAAKKSSKPILVPPARPLFQYAVKFICMSSIPGTSQHNKSFLPGHYQTIVNIHNPLTKPVRFRTKLAWPLEISRFFPGELKPDGVAIISCENVHEYGLHLIHGFEGFLVIESVTSLDVSAVYMAGDKTVSSLDVEQIKERRLR